MTDPEQDEAFETYLKRRSVLPDTPAADDRLEPPAALDTIVLRKAREAIKAQAVPDQGRPPRWAVPVALAATIMLCLSVVLNISLNTNRPAANPQRTTAGRADGNIGGERRESVPGDIPSHEVIATAAPESGSARESSSAYAESALSQAATARRGAGRSAAEKAEMLTKRADTSVPGTAPSAAVAPRPPDAAPARESDSAGAPQSDAMGGRHPADPNDWLQQIDALRAAGKIGLADTEMRRFRAAFPGYALKPTPPASSESPR
jgi:hypothetical protein